MRRWYIMSALFMCVAIAMVFGSWLWSSGQAQEAKNGDKQHSAPKLANSRIDRVTVYPNNALVTREVEVPAGNGLIELIVNPMPDQIVPSGLISNS